MENFFFKCIFRKKEMEDINQIQEEILPENGLQWRKKSPDEIFVRGFKMAKF